VRESIFLGFIQGLTEFLPISSSGHLVLLGRTLFSHNPSPSLVVFLHGGTLLAIIVYFYRDLAKLILSLYHWREPAYHNGRRFISFLVIATLPVALVGYMGEKFFFSFYNLSPFLSLFFFLTGTLLFFSEKFPPRKIRHLFYRNSFIIGVAQVFALFPGISRSGVTVATGLLMGVKRRESFRFSFFLAIPAIMGAMFKETLGGNIFWGSEEITGFLVSFLTGFFALYLFHWVLAIRKLKIFSFYLWGVSLLSLYLFLNSFS